MHPYPTSLHEFAHFLGCETPSPPNSMHEFTQIWGIWCTSSPPACLQTFIPFTHFALGPSLKKMGAPSPTSGSGPAYITISSLLLQYAMKPET